MWGPGELALDEAAMVHLEDGREGGAWACSWEGVAPASTGLLV